MNNNNYGNGNGNFKQASGNLWVSRSKKGTEYFSISINGKKYVAFRNNYKDKETSPDFKIYEVDSNNNNNNSNNYNNNNYSGNNTSFKTEVNTGNNNFKKNTNYAGVNNTGFGGENSYKQNNYTANKGDYGSKEAQEYNFTNGEDDFDSDILNL